MDIWQYQNSRHMYTLYLNSKEGGPVAMTMVLSTPGSFRLSIFTAH